MASERCTPLRYLWEAWAANLVGAKALLVFWHTLDLEDIASLSWYADLDEVIALSGGW
jgi:hypothetical protein